ncbi:hypothetical protein GCM10022217_40320 [Chryseobacterium ginsenosidimutans]|uniref:FEKKY domain-containing protein n=1 Tax=Chryseobacterium ginsenosidimutans TaxID=687846 RepID=UPI0031D4A6FB
MLKILSFLLALMLTFSCEKKEGTMIHEDGYYWFLSYGYPNFQRIKLEDGISEKWKIKTIRVAGCVITEELMDSVRIENKKTNVALQKKYGKNWEKDYEKDIEDFTMKQVDIMDILITNKMFRKKLASYNIEIDDVEKDAKELDRHDFYKVNIYKDYSTIAFTVNVDIKNRTVNLIK